MGGTGRDLLFFNYPVICVEILKVLVFIFEFKNIVVY